MLNKDFKELFILLSRHNVDYLVVGGYAVAFHGYPRYTKDIDIWISRERDNVQKLLKCLDDFGFGSLGLKAEDFMEGDHVVQLGYPPRRIDLITGIEGLNFQVAYERRKTLDIEGLHICCVDLTDLIESKRIAGRLQDLADIEKLKLKG